MKTPKITVEDLIFRKQYDGEGRVIPFGDLPTDLQPTDILYYESDPGYWSENNSWDPFTEIQIARPRLETDEEYEARLEKNRLFREDLKDGRRKNYLKLKEEFDPPNEKK